MPSVRPVLPTAALQILQQVNAEAVPRETAPAGTALVAAANGIVLPGSSGARAQANARISESLFDHRPNLQEMKFDLFRRLGSELGVNMDDYEDPHDYASALRRAIAKIKTQPDAMQILRAIEKELGLNELGLTLDDLIDAIDDPDGKVAKKLNEALIAQMGGDADSIREGIKIDEAGLYSL